MKEIKKELKLKALNTSAKELLSREQMKTIYGGTGYQSECTNDNDCGFNLGWCCDYQTFTCIVMCED